MNILIHPLSKTHGNCWQVRIDQHAVSFRSETEARQFVDILQTRLRAPHPLPQLEQRAAG